MSINGQNLKHANPFSRLCLIASPAFIDGFTPCIDG